MIHYTLIHYTLNTGHTRVSPRSEVGAEIPAVLAPLLRAGEHDLPIEGYRCTISIEGTGLLCSVYHSQRPCVTFGVAAHDAAAEQLWPALERCYLQLGDQPGIRSADFAAPRRPQSAPWCAAITVAATPDEAYWLADFERCLAWAWIERQGE